MPIDYLNQCLELAKDGSKIKEMAMAQLRLVRESMVNHLEDDEDEEGEYSSDDDSGTGSSVSEFGL